MRLCEQAGFQPKVAQEATPPEVVVSFVEAGAGVSLVASGAQTRHNAGVVYRAIAESTSCLEIAVAWNKSQTSIQLNQFLEVVRQSCLGILLMWKFWISLRIFPSNFNHSN